MVWVGSVGLSGGPAGRRLGRSGAAQRADDRLEQRLGGWHHLAASRGRRLPGRGAVHVGPAQHDLARGGLRGRRQPHLAQHLQHGRRFGLRGQHARCERSQLQRAGPPVGQQLAQDALVVAAHEGARRAHPDPAVPACHVPDEVVQRLRHRRSAGRCQLGEQLVGCPAAVQGAAHAGRGEPVHGRAAAGLHVRRHVHQPAQLDLQRPRGHRGQVGLQQHVVHRRRQQRRDSLLDDRVRAGSVGRRAGVAARSSPVCSSHSARPAALSAPDR